MKWLQSLMLLVCLASSGFVRAVEQPDEVVRAWEVSLAKHVVLSADGHSSSVDYSALKLNRLPLKEYLDSASAVMGSEFDRWGKAKQLAFLINVYNASTIDLVLTGYPGIQSIKDLGSFVQSPWKRRFVQLFGSQVSLDEIEHGMIRESGKFNEPRVHFAVNCASIGCPALAPRLYSADSLNEQLDSATQHFLMDRSRNRFEDGKLKVSSIFKWYRSDFEQGWRGARSLSQFFALYASSLGSSPELSAGLSSGKMSVQFLEYDWKINSYVGKR